MPPAQPDYVLGVSDQEAQRLRVQHEVFAESTRALWSRAGLAPGQIIMDLGCGPGFAALELAAAIGPRGHVFAVDRSADYLAMARAAAARASLANLTTIELDAEALADEPAIPDHGLDLIHARYLLAYPRRPEAVVAGIARKLRPAGRVVIQDFFNYEFAPALAPRSPIFDLVTRVIAQSIRAEGGDPDIAGRLPALLAAAGLRLAHLSNTQLLARPGSPLWAWRDAFYRSAVPRMTALGRLTPAQAEEFTLAWSAASKSPHAFVLGPVVIELIAENTPA